MSSLDSLHVLLADDNPHMRTITAAILASAGIRKIREAGDGAQALDALRDGPVDIAVVDFNMFPLDGVEFTRLVRNSPDSANPYLPIIMMTGYSEKVRVQEARDAGVTEFAVKPITAKALLDRVNSVIFHPRPFVKTESYFGPDRRRSRNRGYSGPYRRSTDSGAVEIGPGASAA